jgi:hypothetical protein
MLATHGHFTPKVRNRLKTTCIGLGLVRLLQDAGRTEEARMTLASLQSRLQGGPMAPDESSQKPCKANRLKGASRRFSFVALSARHELVQ